MRRPAGTERELQRLRGEHNKWFVAGKTERDMHKWSIPLTCVPQSERCVQWYRQGLGAGIQDSEDRCKEKTGVG